VRRAACPLQPDRCRRKQADDRTFPHFLQVLDSVLVFGGTPLDSEEELELSVDISEESRSVVASSPVDFSWFGISSIDCSSCMAWRDFCFEDGRMRLSAWRATDIVRWSWTQRSCGDEVSSWPVWFGVPFCETFTALAAFRMSPVKEMRSVMQDALTPKPRVESHVDLRPIKGKDFHLLFFIIFVVFWPFSSSDSVF